MSLPHASMRRRRASSVLLVPVALLFIACSGGTEEGKRGVADFRARVAQRSFADIYRAASPEFRQAAPEEQFAGFMNALDRKLGRWQAAPDPAWNITRGTAGHLVVLTYQSQFAKGAVTERFSWRIEHGTAILLGYNVNSPLLVTE